MQKLLKSLSLFCFLFSYASAQETQRLVMRAGTFSLTVDPISGNFGLFDSSQRNVDLASVFFGGEFPSSHIVITVDGISFTLNELEASYPLAMTVGAQIDGIYKMDDLVFETAFFAMNYGESVQPNSVASAIRITNNSRGRSRTVSVKYLLDTDISEPRNRSMLYLPSGLNVTNALLLPYDNLPLYLFFGEKDPGRQFAQGKGYYLYPNISTNIPTAVVIANWKRLNNQEWIPERIEPSLQFDSSEVLDIGVALYFGEYRIEPGGFQDIGFAVSKEKSAVQPIIEQRTLTQGVFDEGRFDFAELIQPSPSHNAPSSLIPPAFNRNNPSSQSSHTPPYPDFPYDDSVWRYMMDLNFRIESEQQKIRDALE